VTVFANQAKKQEGEENEESNTKKSLVEVRTSIPEANLNNGKARTLTKEARTVQNKTDILNVCILYRIVNFIASSRETCRREK